MAKQSFKQVTQPRVEKCYDDEGNHRTWLVKLFIPVSVLKSTSLRLCTTSEARENGTFSLLTGENGEFVQGAMSMWVELGVVSQGQEVWVSSIRGRNGTGQEMNAQTALVVNAEGVRAVSSEEAHSLLSPAPKRTRRSSAQVEDNERVSA